MLEELLPDFFDLKRNFFSSCLLNWTDPDIEDNPDKIEEASEPVLNDDVLKIYFIYIFLKSKFYYDRERDIMFENKNMNIKQ